jgi:hypothetical protein
MRYEVDLGRDSQRRHREIIAGEKCGPGPFTFRRYVANVAPGRPIPTKDRRPRMPDHPSPSVPAHQVPAPVPTRPSPVPALPLLLPIHASAPVGLAPVGVLRHG